MRKEDVQMVARLMIARHGRGASLLAYQHVVRAMFNRDRRAAENWCRVLLAIEETLTQV